MPLAWSWTVEYRVNDSVEINRIPQNLHMSMLQHQYSMVPAKGTVLRIPD